MTVYLLDTHSLVWWWLDRPTLSARARDLLSSTSPDLRVSAVTGFEIAQKVRIGKWPEMAESLSIYVSLLDEADIVEVAVTGEQARLAGIMTGEHRDPFDRFIAAQALTRGWTVVTRDPAFAAFGCKTFW
jgi:PIN domain nuclease of toxin-antitoxin system